MADNEEKKIISIEIDQSAKDKLVKGLKEVQDAQKRVAVEGLALGKSAAVIAKDVQALTKQERDLKTVLSAVDADIDKQTSSFKEAAAAAGDYESRLRAIKEGGADLSGDIAGSLGGIRGATSAVGLGGITDVPLGIAEAAADLGEFLPKLKVGLEAVSKSGTGVVSTVASLAAGALPAAGASFGAIAVAIAPIAIAGAAVAGAFALVSAGLDQASKAAARQAEAQIAANESVNALLGSGATTGDALKSTVEQAQEIDIAYQNLVDAQAEYENYLTRRGSNFLQAFGDAVGFYGDEEQVFADAVTRTQNTFTELTTAYDETQQAIAAGEFAANDLTRAEEELAATREETAKQAIIDAEQSAQRLAQLEQQRSDLIANRAIAESNAAASNALESKFAKEDEKAETAAHYSALAAIQKTGLENIRAITEEINALPTEQAQELAQISDKGTKELNKLSGDYFAQQIKATKDYAKESGRIASDTAKAAKRIVEELADNLANAARDNDVVAFLQLQQDGQKELKRNAEDAGEAEKRRAEDFAQQQAEQQSAFQKRQSEIIAGINEEKNKTLQAFAEKRAALEQQIVQERANTQQALANAQARYAQSEALEAQEASRNAQRLALRVSQEDAAFQRTLAAIQAKTNAELSGLAQVAAVASSMAASKYAKPNNITGGGSFGGSSYGSSSGGYASKNTKGGVNINITNSPNVGDIATGSQVTAALGQYNQSLIQTLVGAIAKSQG